MEVDGLEPNPCWEGYEAIGLKEKDCKMVHQTAYPFKEEQSRR